jgi:tetratricopeptide (TPR) repeat protein
VTGSRLLSLKSTSVRAAALAFAILIGLVIPLHRPSDARIDLVEERVWLLPPAGALRVASLGFHAAVADVVWLLTVQYIGGHFVTDRQFPHLRRLVETVVDLDPHFVEAYTLGALFLNYSGGNVHAALDLLERGHRANPGRWEPAHDLARTYYLDLKDYPKALEWFKVTERIPGRPHYVPRFIARLYAATDQRETALELWEAMRKSAANDWVREIADREIAKLKGATGGIGETTGRGSQPVQ